MACCGLQVMCPDGWAGEGRAFRAAWGTWHHGALCPDGETPISGKTCQISSSDGEVIIGYEVIWGQKVPRLNY